MYYNFKVKAELHRVRTMPVRPGGFKLASPQMISSGTLAECITKVMEKRDPDRRAYSITVGPDANSGKTVLGFDDIQFLYEHAEFPKSPDQTSINWVPHIDHLQLSPFKARQ